MADDKVHPTATEMDYPAHNRNYDGFLKLLKWGSILSAITTAVVIYIIAT
ncbi:MAG TPA: aa3-type cytochrome c oxidase subunit IV [Sphingomicrobium sp.]|nr:aa3-type cytochrome c oxidase subunit IV [Sphingomicrobium sp.]